MNGRESKNNLDGAIPNPLEIPILCILGRIGVSRINHRKGHE